MVADLEATGSNFLAAGDFAGTSITSAQQLITLVPEAIAGLRAGNGAKMNKKENFIPYASRSLNRPVRNYSTTEP